MMAAPTAIPHHETSSHHHHHHGRSGSVSNESSSQTTMPPLSRSPTGTSPRGMVSPIYTQAGRSAFSMPGPNSTSTSPTTTTWYSAGFASGNSQRVRSPTGPLTNSSGSSNGNGNGAISSAVSPQRDQFPDAKHPSHFRTASFGSASSSLSSADLRDEPLTPRGTNGGGVNVESVTSMPLGRASSIPLGTSYEQIKSRRDSWSFANAAGNRWSGLQSLRERTATANGGGSGNGNGGSNGAVTMPSYLNETKPVNINDPSVSPTTSNGPMGGLLRKFSLSGGQPLKSPPSIGNAGVFAKTETTSTSPSLTVTSATNVEPTQKDDYFKPTTRGRQNSSSGSQRRRPSPMGERLLMGHFNAH